MTSANDSGSSVRKFWGWGVEGAGPDDAQQAGLARSLAERLGAADLKLDPEPRIEDIALRAPRLQAPASLAGICSTDLELTKGYAEFRGVPGHEFVGRVEQGGGPEWEGRRVVGTINLGCGSCPACVGSGPEHCPHRTVLGIVGKDGAFAEFLSLPVGAWPAITTRAS